MVIISLTDTIYANGSNLYARMSWIFCLSPINMCTRILILGTFFIFYLQWENAAKNVSERANQDELEAVGDDYVPIEGLLMMKTRIQPISSLCAYNLYVFI